MSPALMRVLRVVVLLSAVRGAPLATVTLPPVILEPVPLEPVAPAPPEPAAAEPVAPVPVPSEPVRVDSGADQNISIPINTENILYIVHNLPLHGPIRRSASNIHVHRPVGRQTR
ncbi:unnamed protein product [Gadus morhua 'NCC']